MDISFEAGGSKFNYRVCAVIIKDKKILAMTDERSPYYYLPGGRVKFGETAENAVLRELYEELGIYAKINRSLWINQARRSLQRKQAALDTTNCVYTFSWIFREKSLRIRAVAFL